MFGTRHLFNYFANSGFYSLNLITVFLYQKINSFSWAYVDVLHLFGLDLSWLEQIKQILCNLWKMKNLGDIFYYLGIEVDYIHGDKIILWQSINLEKVLDCFDITDCKSAILQMNQEVANSFQPFDRTAHPRTINWYQSCIK